MHSSSQLPSPNSYHLLTTPHHKLSSTSLMLTSPVNQSSPSIPEPHSLSRPHQQPSPSRLPRKFTPHLQQLKHDIFQSHQPQRRPRLTPNTTLPHKIEYASTQCPTPKNTHKRGLPRKTSHISDYMLIRDLGQGRFGSVMLAVHIATGFVGALKVLKKARIQKQEGTQRVRIIRQLINEIKLQGFLSHPNLIKLYDFFSDEESIYLFCELGCDGQLYEQLQLRVFSEEATSIILRELIRGVAYLHSHDIIHRDIKLENIVLTHGMPKICDFGWSVRDPLGLRSTMCGTPLYLAPQLLQGRKYSQKVDVWALGAMAFELVTRDNPFKIRRRQDLLKVINEDFTMTDGSAQLRSFVTLILRKEVSKRPDAQLLLKHPFLKKYQQLETTEELCVLGSTATQM